MSFWLREIVGWMLLVIGLYFFYLCIPILLTERPLLLQAVPFTFIGFIIFRGGIHMLKVAVAARIAMNEQRQLAKPPATKSPTPKAGLKPVAIRR